MKFGDARMKAERVLCSVSQQGRMPRNSGFAVLTATGQRQKDKKRKRAKSAAEDGAKQTPRLEALEAAAAAPE